MGTKYQLIMVCSKDLIKLFKLLLINCILEKGGGSLFDLFTYCGGSSLK